MANAKRQLSNARWLCRRAPRAEEAKDSAKPYRETRFVNRVVISRSPFLIRHAPDFFSNMNRKSARPRWRGQVQLPSPAQVASRRQNKRHLTGPPGILARCQQWIPK